jgi:hypothetical protein
LGKTGSGTVSASADAAALTTYQLFAPIAVGVGEAGGAAI